MLRAGGLRAGGIRAGEGQRVFFILADKLERIDKISMSPADRITLDKSGSVKEKGQGPLPKDDTFYRKGKEPARPAKQAQIRQGIGRWLGARQQASHVQTLHIVYPRNMRGKPKPPKSSPGARHPCKKQCTARNVHPHEQGPESASTKEEEGPGYIWGGGQR